MAKGVE
jgi:hypothetical protein